MPGVPPDAVAQVKKGLRGLFSRRKSKQGQQTQPTPTTSTRDAPTGTSTAAAAVPATAASAVEASKSGPSGNPPAPQPASADLNKAPQLSEPSQSELAKDIDLNPTASDIKDDPPSEPVKPPAITTDPAKATSEESKGLTTEPSSAPKAAAAPSTGMSATSGPLSDHMDEGYIDDDDVDVGPKGEKLEDVGKTAESVGGAKEAESEQLQEGGKA